MVPESQMVLQSGQGVQRHLESRDEAMLGEHLQVEASSFVGMMCFELQPLAEIWWLFMELST